MCLRTKQGGKGGDEEANDGRIGDWWRNAKAKLHSPEAAADCLTRYHRGEEQRQSVQTRIMIFLTEADAEAELEDRKSVV